ncbi:MAG: Trk system potassium transporter TrkA [Ruminococcaceae bacterium]|nr:Trk system potassium transporter TrkA [Oscillospiraceae bacterium]
MKVIIVGSGKVGEKLLEKLSAEPDIEITLIDIKADAVSDIVNDYDAMGVVGSGIDIETLDSAGVKDADIVIAVTGSDEINLMTCLIAKKKGNCQTIARVRQPEYRKTVELIKEDLGLTMIVNPEFAAASEIARALRFPSAIQIDTFAHGRVEILKFKVPVESVLNGLKVSDIVYKLNCDILVCGVERGDDAFIPSGDFVINGGDLVSIVAAPTKATPFFKKIGIKTNKVKDAMIIGGGATAFYLSKLLLRTGISVKIIEQKRERCEHLAEALPEAIVICADATDNKLLLEEGIDRAESVVTLTNIDEENIMLSLYAKSMSVGKVVTKINRIAYDNVIDNLELDTIIYPKNITAEYILRFVRAKKNSLGNNIETLHYILDGKAEALEFKITADIGSVTDIPIETLKIKKNVLITCINRGGKIIHPRGADVIKKDDTVIIVTTHKGFENITDILE